MGRWKVSEESRAELKVQFCYSSELPIGTCYLWLADLAKEIATLRHRETNPGQDLLECGWPPWSIRRMPLIRFLVDAHMMGNISILSLDHDLHAAPFDARNVVEGMMPEPGEARGTGVEVIVLCPPLRFLPRFLLEHPHNCFDVNVSVQHDKPPRFMNSDHGIGVLDSFFSRDYGLLFEWLRTRLPTFYGRFLLRRTPFRVPVVVGC